MWRWWSGALVALALGSACSCEDRVVGSDGLAVVEPGELDFGRVALGGTGTREVRLRNAGRAPLTLTDLEIDGLGTDFDLATRGARVLAAGEETTVVVRYTPLAEEVLARTLRLRVDDRKAPEVPIPVTGVALRPRVVPDPISLDFGRIELGTDERRTVTLHNDFDMPVVVRLGLRGDAQFRFAPTDEVTVDANGTATLEATFAAVRTGRAYGAIVVQPCPTCAELEIPMAGVGIEQAIVVTPTEIDFGYVAIDRKARREISITNVGSKPLEVLGVATDGRRPAFQTKLEPVTLAEGELLRVPVTFQPTRLGPDEGTLLVQSTARRAPRVPVQLRGVGGGPEISVVPGKVAFGTVPQGSLSTRTVTITNAGSDPALPPLQLADVSIQGDGAFAAVSPEGPLEIPAGGSLEVQVTFEPMASGPFAAKLRIASNDGSMPEAFVDLTGTAAPAPACELVVTPAAIDFGQLDEGRGAVLGFKVHNPGEDVCVLRGVDVAPGSDPVFHLPGGRIESFVLRGDSWFGRMVAFDPHAVEAGEGDYRGELELYVFEGEGRRRISVPLTASSGDGCLRPAPRFVDFGRERVDCGLHDATVTYENTCDHEVVVTDIALGDATTPDEHAITAMPQPPFAVAAGDAFGVGVRWLSRTRGANYTPLFVTESSRDRPLLVPLIGDLVGDGDKADRFTQLASGVADVLLVIDNSGSMAEEQTRIASAVGVLVDEALANGIDFHVAVTSTGLEPILEEPTCPGGASGGERGRFFPVDHARPRVITTATPDARQVLADNVRVGLCHHLEQGMEAMKLALSRPLSVEADDDRTPEPNDGNAGFLRPEAQLAVIFVGEEDDHSGYELERYETFLRDLKGDNGFLVSAIVDVDAACAGASGVATRYLDLVARTGGTASSICAADFGPILRQIAARAFQPPTTFTLSATPDAGGVSVFVNEVEVPEADYVYDAATNSIRFDPRARPEPGAAIEVRYTATCG